MATYIEVREKRHREIPCAFNGTPRAPLPAGRAKKDASKKLEQTKMKYQLRLAKGDSMMWPPNSRRDKRAQNETTQNQKEGEIVTRQQPKPIRSAEDRDQCSAETEEPYLCHVITGRRSDTCRRSSGVWRRTTCSITEQKFRPSRKCRHRIKLTTAVPNRSYQHRLSLRFRNNGSDRWFFSDLFRFRERLGEKTADRVQNITG